MARKKQSKGARKPQGRDAIPGLPERVRELRLARGLTQTQLARRVGCADAQISMIETGQRYPSFKLGLALARALDIDPRALEPGE